MSCWMSKVAAVVFCVASAVLTVPGCNELGLGDTGTGGADPQGGTPCQNDCYADYDAAMNVCAKIASDTDRKACQDSAGALREHCLGACNGDPVEECKKQCDKENVNCIGKCPKGDKTCMDKCNQIYGKCLKDCEK